MPDPVRQFDLDDDSAYLPFAETSAAPIDPRDEGRNLGYKPRPKEAVWRW